MKQHMGRPSLTPVEIAHSAGLSLRRLQELFQNEQTTISAELRSMRLDAARRRLVDPFSRDISIQAIMESVGFLDQGQFSRLFKNTYGVNSRALRRK